MIVGISQSKHIQLFNNNLLDINILAQFFQNFQTFPGNLCPPGPSFYMFFMLQTTTLIPVSQLSLERPLPSQKIVM